RGVDGGDRVDPRRDRLPQDHLRAVPDDGRALADPGCAAGRAARAGKAGAVAMAGGVATCLAPPRFARPGAARRAFGWSARQCRATGPSSPPASGGGSRILLPAASFPAFASKGGAPPATGGAPPTVAPSPARGGGLGW